MKKAEIIHKKSPPQRDLSYYLGLSVTHRHNYCGWTRTSTGFIQDVLVVGDKISDVMFTCYFNKCECTWELPEDIDDKQRKDWTKWKDFYREEEMSDWTGKSISGMREDFFIDNGYELKKEIVRKKKNRTPTVNERGMNRQ
jgi:hypothetical protein